MNHARASLIGFSVVEKTDSNAHLSDAAVFHCSLFNVRNVQFNFYVQCSQNRTPNYGAILLQIKHLQAMACIRVYCEGLGNYDFKGELYFASKHILKEIQSATRE